MSAEGVDCISLVPVGKRLLADLKRDSGLVVSHEPKGPRQLTIAEVGEVADKRLLKGVKVWVKSGAGVVIENDDGRVLIFDESDVIAIVRDSVAPIEQ